MNKNEIKVSMVGPKKFKGIPYQVEVYRILHKSSIFESLKNLFLAKTKPALGLGLMLVLLLGFAFWQNVQGKQSKLTSDSRVEGLSTSLPSLIPSPSPTPVPTPEPTPKTIYIVITPSPSPTKTPIPKRYKHWPNN